MDISNEVTAVCLFCDGPATDIMLDADDMPFRPFGHTLRICSPCQKTAPQGALRDNAAMLQEFGNSILVRIAQGEQGVRFQVEGNLGRLVQRRVRTTEDLVDLFITGMAALIQNEDPPDVHRIAREEADHSTRVRKLFGED